MVLFGSWLGGCDASNPPGQTEVRIDAAASIAPVIERMAEAIEHELGIRVSVNAGSSGMLAQQVTRGDRVDVFISADTLWMDGLSKQGLIDKATRSDVAGNQLVLIGLAGVGVDVESISIEDLTDARHHPIAVGDPAYVPAGRYAMQVLAAHGLDDRNRLRLAEAPNVRAVVAFVMTGQCPVGLVYASDVREVEGIEVLLAIDPADHDPIRYPAAVLKDAPNHDAAVRVLAWLRGEQAKAALTEAGFITAEDIDD